MFLSRKNFIVFLFVFISNSYFIANTFASNFTRPADNVALIGSIFSVNTYQNDSPATLGKRYNVGVNAIVAANPGVGEQSLFKSGNLVEIPNQFLLPPLPRAGIIINLPEMRLYYFPENSHEILTFPIGIGRIGKTIPITRTYVTRKKIDPVWIPPKDIREFNRARGIELPKVMPPGPDNPLGPYAIYLRVPTYLIHSTIFPESIGTRASFGCIRMHESDIMQFFPDVQPGTLVEIINMPNKIAWNQQKLFLESHPPLEEHAQEESVQFAEIVREIEKSTQRVSAVTLVNWPLVMAMTEQPDGIPREIGKEVL